MSIGWLLGPAGLRDIQVCTASSLHRRTVLAERVLHCDAPVAKGEQVAAVGLDARAVGPGAGEGPFRHAPLAVDEVPAIAPLRIGKVLPGLGECDAHSLAALVAGAAGERAA